MQFWRNNLVSEWYVNCELHYYFSEFLLWYDILQTELSKIIAKMYHELNDRKKQKYSEMAEKEKEAYLEKMRKFT